MENNNINGICPNCGRNISVPNDLEKFACVYCGTMLTPADIAAKPAVFSTDKNYDGLMADALPMIAASILENLNIMSEFTRTDYTPSFERYVNKYHFAFMSLDKAAHCEGADFGQTVEAAVDYFMNAIEESLPASSRAQGDKVDQYRRIIALYMVPMVKFFKLTISTKFTETLRDKWIAKYPKYPFMIGEYEAIAGGFRKKFLGLCFITSAVCEQSGKPDDCYELTSFRNFRDGYLANCSDGPALIEEYYETAPVILTCMDLFGTRENELENVRDTYLAPCLSDIENGKLESCKSRYIEMVRYLQNKYLPA